MGKRGWFGSVFVVMGIEIGLAWQYLPQPWEGIPSAAVPRHLLHNGDRAPDFALGDVTGERPVTLSGLRGKPVVLFFGSCT